MEIIPNHIWTLALADERHGLLADAEREILASLRLNPGQPDALNSLGVIYAEEGKTDCASLVWRELVREAPDYEPARTNLALMGNQSRVARGETAAVALLPAAAVKAIGNEHKPRLPASEMRPRPAHQVENKYHGRISSTGDLDLRIITGRIEP